MFNIICSFFGHREIEISNNLKSKISKILIDLIENKKVNTFYFGGFGMFDDLCYQIVSELQQIYTHIQRVFCVIDKRFLRPNKRPHWLKTKKYEKLIYLDITFDYWYTRIFYRNCEIINQSEYTIFYVLDKNTTSGAYKTLRYAQKKKKQYINIANDVF